jgi:predicted ABC-type ATPase
MSHPSKVDFIEKATLRGYESVLYFVSTADPEINVVRVAERVEQGGHDVPRDRIIDRYYRSVKLLPFAVHHSRQAYIFDNTRDGDYALFLGLQKSTETSGKANYTLFPGAPSWIESLYKELL